MTDIAHRLGPLPSRAAALALLLGLVWTLTAFLILPAYDSYHAVGEDIASARAQLGRIHGIISEDAETAPILPGEFDGQTWNGKSQSIIAAKLQELIQTQAKKHNVAVISISPLQTRPFEKIRTIGLRIECEGEIGAIRDLIGALENNKPFIFIAGTDMRRQLIFGERKPGQRVPLSVRLDVHVPLKIEENG